MSGLPPPPSTLPNIIPDFGASNVENHSSPSLIQGNSNLPNLSPERPSGAVPLGIPNIIMNNQSAVPNQPETEARQRSELDLGFEPTQKIKLAGERKSVQKSKFLISVAGQFIQYRKIRHRDCEFYAAVIAFIEIYNIRVSDPSQARERINQLGIPLLKNFLERRNNLSPNFHVEFEEEIKAIVNELKEYIKMTYKDNDELYKILSNPYKTYFCWEIMPLLSQVLLMGFDIYTKERRNLINTYENEWLVSLFYKEEDQRLYILYL